MISFEHAVFLLTALVRGNELVLSACRECSAVLIIDRWSLRAPRCALCAVRRRVSCRPDARSARLAP
jgi:hypothetical protein